MQDKSESTTSTGSRFQVTEQKYPEHDPHVRSHQQQLQILGKRESSGNKNSNKYYEINLLSS